MTDLVPFFIDEITRWTPKIGGAIIILFAFYLIAKLSQRAIAKGAIRMKLDSHLTTLFARVVNLTILIFGCITALGTIGINVSALIAGLGLTGFALGFALKDTISNLLSGVLILLYKPFCVGNRIKIAGYEGDVVSIDLRYTELSSKDNRILIPNSKLFTDPVSILNKQNAKA